MTRALLLAGFCSAFLFQSHAIGSPASKLYKLGVKAESAGSIAEAFLYYTQAAAADPKKTLYRDRADALAPMAAMHAQAKPPLLDVFDSGKGVAPRIDLTPDHGFDSITARELALQNELLPPQRLDLKPGLQSYDLEGDYKSLFERLADRLGLRVVFDGDYQSSHHVRFKVENVDSREALHDLEAATNSFVTPLGPQLFIVAQDTDAKRKDLEQVETASVPIPSVLTVQEITELGQAVKQAVGIDKVFWDSQVHQIVLRDRVSRVLAAESVLRDLISYPTQVEIDLEFIELNETQMLELGVDLQTSFTISFLSQLLTGNIAGATASASQSANLVTLAQLAKYSVGQMFGVGISNVNVIAKMSKAGARNLLRTTIVSSEGQKASFHVGSKYPIITSQYVGASTNSGQGFATAPSFTFEDLGIVVNVTPHAHGMGEISMDLDTEFKILGSDSVNGIPIVSSRKMQSTVRLKDNQWALVAGLTTDSKSRQLSGPAFFSHIPLLGHLISHFTTNNSKTYVILALKPRLLSIPPDQRITHQVFVGTETRTVTPL